MFKTEVKYLCFWYHKYMKRIEIAVPEYTVESEPNYESIGRKIDNALMNNFSGDEILLRGIGSSEHNIDREELIQTIITTGTDRYDEARRGDRYENVDNKHIDLFAFEETVHEHMNLGWQVIYGFYHSAISVHGRPTKIDILTIYDASYFDVVEHRYHGRTDIKTDGFAFKDGVEKSNAVIGIIELL